jgi:putative glycosyltransferase (TIGR04348 family)
MSGGVALSILLVTPAPPRSTTGNGVTAQRWSTLLRVLGHKVRIRDEYDGRDYDVLVALHARKSAAAIRAFHAALPHAPVVVALTGTDLYPSLSAAGVDPDVLTLASRFVVLQPLGLKQLEATLRERARVVVQSMPPVPAQRPRDDCFEVAFLAHLRPVKDPLRLAAAVRRLPATSRIRVTHLGAGHDDSLARAAAAESAANPRYDWIGPRPRRDALAVLARSRLMALTSLHEGGANVVSEALAAGVPIVASAIPGSIGLLGGDYPGYFTSGDTDSLAALLLAAERDEDGLYRSLREWCLSRRITVDPAHELEAWATLLSELQLFVSI